MEHRLSRRGPGSVATIGRRLLLFATTATALALAGCGDSGEASEDNAAGAGRRTLASDPAWYGDNTDPINVTIAGTRGKAS